MAQQTAVEYLIEKLYTIYRFEFSGTIVDQAKQMEKQQITHAYDEGFIDCEIEIENDVTIHNNSEEYYKETYDK